MTIGECEKKAHAEYHERLVRLAAEDRAVIESVRGEAAAQIETGREVEMWQDFAEMLSLGPSRPGLFPRFKEASVSALIYLRALEQQEARHGAQFYMTAGRAVDALRALKRQTEA